MDVGTLKSHIINNTFNQMYVFTGDEVAIQNIYIKKIAEVQKLSITRCDTVLDIFTQLKNKRLFAQSATLYIALNDKDYISDYEKYAELSNVIKDNIVILLYDSIDKRSKFYKNHTEDIVEFEKLSRDILIQYIQRDIALSSANANMLADMCDDDYSRILLEINKIKCYADSLNIDINDSFINLVTEHSIYSAPYDAIFDFVDSVLNRQYQKSFRLLQECRGVDEASLVMLSVLYNSFKQTLQVQSYTGNDVLKATGLTKWQVNKAESHRDKYRTGELVRAMKIISKIVSDIKIGKIDDSVAVDYALVNIL